MRPHIRTRGDGANEPKEFSDAEKLALESGEPDTRK